MTSMHFKRCREYAFPLSVGVLLAIWGTVPYLHAYWVAPENSRHMGFVGRGTSAKCGYLMFAKQAQSGRFLMENRMTSEPLPRRYASIEWWLFGSLARCMDVSLLAVYQLSRVFAAIAFPLGVYFLASQCLGTVFRRRLALLAVCFGSGLGWIILAGDKFLGLPFPYSSDLKGSTLSGFLLANPHFVFEAMFASLKYGFMIQGERSGRRSSFVCAGIAACGQTAIRPFHLVETHLVCLLMPVVLNLRDGRWSSHRVYNYCTVLVLHAPMLLFTLYVSRGNPLGVEGLTLSEGYFNIGWGRPGLFWETAFWLGLPFVLCCLALPWILTRRTSFRPDIILGIVFLVAGLLYNAYPYWGAGLEASVFAFMVLPPVLAAGRPLTWLNRALRRAWFQTLRRQTVHWLVAAMFLIVCFPSTIYVYAALFSSVKRTDTAETYYLTEAQCRVLAWLEAETPPGSVVLAEPRVSQYIPWVAHNKVVLAHTMLTPQFYQKMDDVLRYFNVETSSEFRLSMTKRYGVRYVMAPDPAPWDPQAHPWLHVLHTDTGITVYGVEP